MINKSVNGRQWTTKAVDKLKSYLKRAPISVDMVIGTENCTDGVFIIDKLSKTKYFFAFNYETDPKVWVHNIKYELVNLYPRIIEDIYEEVDLTPKEMALKIEAGEKPENIQKSEKRLVKQNCWRIDKTLDFQDIFVLTLEGVIEDPKDMASFKVAKAPINQRYKYQGSSVIFLDNYWNNKYGSVIEASEEFFKRAIFVDEVAVKSEA